MSLVLNILTSMVSPKFHYKADEMFETVNVPEDSNYIRWQIVTRFVGGKFSAETKLHVPRVKMGRITVLGTTAPKPIDNE